DEYLICWRAALQAAFAREEGVSIIIFTSSLEWFKNHPMNGQPRATPFRVVFAGIIQPVVFAGQLPHVVQ
ncbi:MAG: hypothetical protein ACK5G9_04950, partial [Akkermansiaceae bacterium]